MSYVEARSTIVEIDVPNCLPPVIWVDNSHKLPENNTLEISNFNQKDLIESTSHSLSTLNETLGSLPDGSYILAFVSALTSVLAAFIFNLVYWKIVNQKEKQLAAISEFEALIHSTEKAVTEYWLHPYKPRHQKKNSIQEIRMFHDIPMLMSLGDEVIARLPWYVSKLQKLKLKTEIITFVNDLFDVATNSDDFKSPTRAEDLKRVTSAIKLCSSMKITLSGHKR
ncbi:hypothetical protein [Vibrio cyclitrophicus]|uniref:hypothetical protein n=1 Tax=Vibrio cyclitrophicus TaxID=47951 RepID=UPI000C82011C|nr:hypothetical protein [Vibrio cyclitrophicus]PMH73234.1 hypothetical protein BCU59_05505 [Vibrio cyclitrophicus]